jgi:hypothetical protein
LADAAKAREADKDTRAAEYKASVAARSAPAQVGCGMEQGCRHMESLCERPCSVP